MQIMPVKPRIISNEQKPKSAADILSSEIAKAKNELYEKIFKNTHVPSGNKLFTSQLKKDMIELTMCEKLQQESKNIMSKIDIMPQNAKNDAQDRLMDILKYLTEKLSKTNVNKDVLKANIEEIMKKISKV